VESHIKYRPEIDGLRTIAVLAVIIYHAEIYTTFGQLLPGGFLGVDVFFVISGYLITSLISKEYQRTGSFSVLNFYERRARRLLPALLIVLLAALPVAWALLLPTQLIRFSESALASLLFGSNFYWSFSLQEYGAESALLQPLLHTWSLAVEEQYYIVFPLFLVALLSRSKRATVAAVWVGLVVSLIFSQWYTQVDSAFSFYLLPSRLWELLAGAILALAPTGMAKSTIQHTLSLLGILLLGYSLVFLEYGAGHPGLVTLVPVLGAALVIRYSAGGGLVARILASRGMVSIGLISYSLYLWHYPIFSFARIASIEETMLVKFVGVVLTFLFSVATYRFIEKPFRDRKRVTRILFLVCVLSGLLLVAVFSVGAILNDGFKNRLFGAQSVHGLNQLDNGILKDESWALLNQRAKASGYGDSRPHSPSEFEAHKLWFKDASKTRKVLIVGDSLSKDVYNALVQNDGVYFEWDFARFGMFDPRFKKHLAVLLASPNFKEADTILFSYRIHRGNFPRVEKLMNQIAASGKEIYITSTPVEFALISNKPVTDWYLERNRSGFQESELGEILYESRLLSERRILDRRLANLAVTLGIEILDLWPLACEEERSACSGLTEDGYKIYYDDVHWTLKGSKYFGAKMAEADWLRSP
jgi:peptidoglycan/LPS O-acetylase OafA/YrhL